MMFLTTDEVQALTGKKRRAQQQQVLEAIGVHYIENGIGEIVVSRAHVERLLEGRQEITNTGPDFGSLRKAS